MTPEELKTISERTDDLRRHGLLWAEQALRDCVNEIKSLNARCERMHNLQGALSVLRDQAEDLIDALEAAQARADDEPSPYAGAQAR